MRFGLRTLLATTTVCAVGCAVFFAVPLVVELVVLAMIVLVAPSVWICGACFAKGRWRAFFLGGLCAGWLPSAVLMYFGGFYGVSALSEGTVLEDWGASSAEYSLLMRSIVAGCFLFPGFVACLGGGCGALVYHWFGVERSENSPAAGSRLHEPYVLMESRVTPLVTPVTMEEMRP